jgi:phage terminase small subunit
MIEIDKTLKPLTFRQERFVSEFVATGNATRSAETAGYAHPNHQAFRLLVNISVKAAIDAERNRLMSDSEDKLASYVSDLEALSKSADQSGTRVRALELLIKVVGGFAPEKQEVTSFHGSFLADLDLEEDELPELLTDNSKDISDLH